MSLSDTSPTIRLGELASCRELNEIQIRPEILEMAEELLSGCDGIGVERSSVAFLVRMILFLDRRQCVS
jgi:hypothetical protein